MGSSVCVGSFSDLELSVEVSAILKRFIYETERRPLSPDTIFRHDKGTRGFMGNAFSTKQWPRAKVAYHTLVRHAYM